MALYRFCSHEAVRAWEVLLMSCEVQITRKSSIALNEIIVWVSEQVQKTTATIRAKEEMERLIRRDLKDMNLDEDKWYNKATTSRHGGHLVVLVLRTTENNLYNTQSIPVVRQITCEVCMQNVS